MTLHDEGERFTGKMALQGADRVKLRTSFGDAARDRLLGSRVGAPPTDDENVESAVGATIATAVQAVPDGFAEQGRHKTDTTECSEAGLGTHALGIAASEVQAEKVDDFGCAKIAELKETGAKSGREIACGLNAAVVRTARGGTRSATHVMRLMQRIAA